MSEIVVIGGGAAGCMAAITAARHGVPVTLLANGFSGLCLILTCASVAIIVAKHAGNIDRMIKHKEPKITFRKDISHKLDNDSF